MLAGRRGRGGAAWAATSTAGALAEDSIVGGNRADGAAGRRSGGGTEDGGGTEEEDGGTVVGEKGRFGARRLEDRRRFDPIESWTLAEFYAAGTQPTLGAAVASVAVASVGPSGASRVGRPSCGITKITLVEGRRTSK